MLSIDWEILSALNSRMPMHYHEPTDSVIIDNVAANWEQRESIERLLEDGLAYLESYVDDKGEDIEAVAHVRLSDFGLRVLR